MEVNIPASIVSVGCYIICQCNGAVSIEICIYYIVAKVARPRVSIVNPEIKCLFEYRKILAEIFSIYEIMVFKVVWHRYLNDHLR